MVVAVFFPLFLPAYHITLEDRKRPVTFKSSVWKCPYRLTWKLLWGTVGITVIVKYPQCLNMCLKYIWNTCILNLQFQSMLELQVSVTFYIFMFLNTLCLNSVPRATFISRFYILHAFGLILPKRNCRKHVLITWNVYLLALHVLVDS